MNVKPGQFATLKGLAHNAAMHARRVGNLACDLGQLALSVKLEQAANEMEVALAEAERRFNAHLEETKVNEPKASRLPYTDN